MARLVCCAVWMIKSKQCCLDPTLKINAQAAVLGRVRPKLFVDSASLCCFQKAMLCSDHKVSLTAYRFQFDNSVVS